MPKNRAERMVFFALWVFLGAVTIAVVFAIALRLDERAQVAVKAVEAPAPTLPSPEPEETVSRAAAAPIRLTPPPPPIVTIAAPEPPPAAKPIVLTLPEEVTKALKTLADRPPAPPALAPVSACVAQLQSFAARTQIYFDTGSAGLDRRARAALDLLQAMAARCPEAQVQILGFADPVGDPALNHALSLRRAEAALAFLHSRGGTARFRALSHFDHEHDAECLHFDVVDRRVAFRVGTTGHAP